MKKIIITGGSGLLGRYLIENLLGNNTEIVVLTTRDIDSTGPEVKFCTTDYSIDDLAPLLDGADGVVHLAAQRSVEKTFSGYFPSISICDALYKVCADLGIANIVFASSISVYSSVGKLPWRENQKLEPVSFYGLSKFACEELGNWYNRAGKLFVKNLRLSHLFGANEQNNYMINLFMRKAFHKQEITLMAPSIAKREFLYAKDAANAISLALAAPEVAGSYNISSNEVLTNLEVAHIINAVFNNEAPIRILDPSANEGIHSSFMTGDKAKDVLHYEAQFSLEEALLEIKSEMEKMPNVPIRY